jgi:hypothetical protein
MLRDPISSYLNGGAARKTRDADPDALLSKLYFLEAANYNRLKLPLDL